MYPTSVNQPAVETPQIEGEEKKAQGVSRPIGVSILVVWNMIGALLLIFAAFVLGLEAGPRDSLVLPLVTGLLGVGQFLIARGLWKLRNWARLVAIVCYGFSATAGLIGLFLGNPLGILQMLIAGSLVRYLTRDHVVQAFSGS